MYTGDHASQSIPTYENKHNQPWSPASPYTSESDLSPLLASRIPHHVEHHSNPDTLSHRNRYRAPYKEKSYYNSTNINQMSSRRHESPRLDKNRVNDDTVYERLTPSHSRQHRDSNSYVNDVIDRERKPSSLQGEDHMKSDTGYIRFNRDDNVVPSTSLHSVDNTSKASSTKHSHGYHIDASTSPIKEDKVIDGQRDIINRRQPRVEVDKDTRYEELLSLYNNLKTEYGNIITKVMYKYYLSLSLSLYIYVYIHLMRRLHNFQMSAKVQNLEDQLRPSCRAHKVI